MTKILKRIAAFSLLVAVAFQMVACAGDTAAPAETTGQDTSTQEEAPAAGTTLSVAIWDTNQEPGLKEIMADFTAETGIEVNIQVTPWQQYWTMLEAGATGGTLPDVFWMHTNEFSRYAEYEMLLDITDRVAASEVLDMTKFPEILLISTPTKMVVCMQYPRISTQLHSGTTRQCSTRQT